MKRYKELWFKSRDNLKLFARDYESSGDQASGEMVSSKKTIVCIPGLTRSSADFSELCEYLSDRYRVIAVDLRGRGLSQYDPNPLNYYPGIYAQDIHCLVDELGLENVVLFGTSLGGMVSMIFAATHPKLVEGIVLNDIGPEINPDGLDRIRSYLVDSSQIESWNDAVSRTREIHGKEFPNLTDADWRSFAEKLYREDSRGLPQLNYDPAISVAFEQNDKDGAPQADLWPMFALLSKLPVLVLRGELSDILSEQCVAKMLDMHPQMRFTQIKNMGHAPILDGAEIFTSIEGFLDDL